MLIDMHMHEKTFSKDSFLALDEMVSAAREKGLDGICITDHDSIGLKEQAELYSRETGFPIFVGVEYYSLEGDIVAFGIDSIPDHRVHAQAFIDYVKENDGICFSAHPFRSNDRGLKENLLLVHGLDGVEVLNGSTSPEANEKAYQYAKKLGLKTIGSSDCHTLDRLGRFVTFFPENIDTVTDLIRVFRSAALQPAVFINGSYQIIPV